MIIFGSIKESTSYNYIMDKVYKILLAIIAISLIFLNVQLAYQYSNIDNKVITIKVIQDK